MAGSTEREEAQNALIASIADQSIFGVAVLTGPELTFVSANEGYRLIVGNRDIVGKPILEAIPELRGQGVDTAMHEIMRTGEAMTFREQMYMIDATGTGRPEPRYYSFIWQPVRGADGAIASVLILTHDVTSSVKARAHEQEMRSAAEEANRLKDDFIATVSHELRTPLSSILGWVQLLRQGPMDETQTVRALETIERNARAQSQLIEDLLDVARIASGKLTLEITRVSLVSVLTTVIETARPTAAKKDVTLHLQVDDDLSLYGDAIRLQQIVSNLVTNAVKFSANGGRVDVQLKETDGEAEVSVCDHGAGISADFLPHVFERFRQAPGAAPRAQGGLGLGLSIVKQLVELHSGRVSAESKGQGHGATFRVRLPLGFGDEPRRSEPPQRMRSSPFVNARLVGFDILVVDNEPDALNLHASVLEACGATTRRAISAAEALVLVDDRVPSCILSDIGMPDVDGYGFIGAVRRRGLSVPAIAITAFADDATQARALEAGFNDFLSKPVQPADLVAAVLALLARP